MPEYISRDGVTRREGGLALLPEFAALFLLCLVGAARPAASSEELTPDQSKRIARDLKVLRSKDARLTELKEAAADLADMESPAVRARLLEEMRKSDDANVIYWVCRVLTKKEPAEVAAFLSGRIERSPEAVDFRLIELLGDTGQESAVAPLVKIVRASGENGAPSRQRSAALSGLAGIGGPDATKAILATFDDENLYVRRAAREAMLKLGKSEGVGGERSEEVAGFLVGRIEKTKGRRTMPLIELLAKVGGDIAEGAVGGYLLSGDDAVVEAGIRAAGSMKAKRAAALLLRIALDKRRAVRIRVMAIGALADVGADEKLAKLVPLLESDEARVRNAAHRALKRLAKKKIPPAVGPWESAVARIEDEREYGPVAAPDLEALPEAIPRVSPAARTAAGPRQAPAGGPTVYVVLGAAVALVVVLVFVRFILVRRTAKAVDRRVRRRRTL